MASGSASYSTNATNYGRNPADAYYYLSAPDTINGPLTVTGNLHVEGTSQLDGAVTCGSTLAVAQDVTVGSATDASKVRAVGPAGSVELNPSVGGFPGIAFTNGALTTLMGLQTSTGPLLVGNNGVKVATLGALDVGGALSVAGASQLNLGSGSFLVNQGANILANVGGIAALSVAAAAVTSTVPVAVTGGITSPQGLVSYRIANLVSPNTSPASLVLTEAQCPFLNDNTISYVLVSLTPNGTGGGNSAQFNPTFHHSSVVGQRSPSPGGIIWSQFSIIPLPGTPGQPTLTIVSTGSGLASKYSFTFLGVTQDTSYDVSVTLFNRTVLNPPNQTP